MVRFLLALLSLAFVHITFSTPSYAQGIFSRSEVPIFYYPYIHARPAGDDYESLGGDPVFFSYIHFALEILKDPERYEIYAEGFFADIYDGSLYQMNQQQTHDIQKHFRNGFPEHISEWAPEQKLTFVKYGPVITLYVLGKINHIRATAEERKSTSELLASFETCSRSDFFKRSREVSMQNPYTTWEQYYQALRTIRQGLSNEACDAIYAQRELYLVDRLKRERGVLEKPILILYGASHDFGQYFDDDIQYLGSPILKIAAFCYNRTKESDSPNIIDYCSKRLPTYLEQLGHASYFSNASHNNHAPTLGHSPYIRSYSPEGDNYSPNIKRITR